MLHFFPLPSSSKNWTKHFKLKIFFPSLSKLSNEVDNISHPFSPHSGTKLTLNLDVFNLQIQNPQRFIASFHQTHGVHYIHQNQPLPLRFSFSLLSPSSPFHTHFLSSFTITLSSSFTPTSPGSFSSYLPSIWS